MAKLAIQVADIKGLTPAIDARANQDVFLLESRNVSFAADGLKSDFGAAIIGSAQVVGGTPSIAQSINIQERTHLCTSTGIYTVDPNDKTFDQLLDLSAHPAITTQGNEKWTAAYLSLGAYFCHPAYGFWRLRDGVFTRLTPETTPGLPRYPLAVAESNGRLLILSNRFVTWSAPSNAERFIPELGGAGQQLLSDRITGVPTAIAGFQMGFLVWTDKDCMVCEYIGGDTVFRYQRTTTEQIPLSAWVVQPMPDGSQVIVTVQGLFRIVNGQEPQPLTPLFNDFLRRYVSQNGSLELRLDYSFQEDRIYLSQRNKQRHYNRTFVLSLGLDKWGSFDRPHLGLLVAERGKNPSMVMGMDGRIRRFKHAMRFYETSPGVFGFTDSMAQIGYLRPAELPEADTLFELQEVVVGNKSRVSTSDYVVTDYNAEPDSVLDYNAVSAATEDYSDQTGPLNHIPHKISVVYDLDGTYAGQDGAFELAVERTGMNLYTGYTSGMFHRLQFETVNPGDGFHIGFVNATAYYHGQMV